MFQGLGLRDPDAEKGLESEDAGRATQVAHLSIVGLALSRLVGRCKPSV